ncbi:hypothetical protein HYT32_01035 [Candidatus Roizmanbacteria bacterium]|nr:hypothetical protein [Candidatus Roizmanbacteria bacterium]
MKKLSVLFFLSILFLVFASGVFAQTATSPSSLKDKMTDLKEERASAISQAKEQMQLLRDQFKERLQTIKDTRKRILTEKIDSNIANANKKHTDRFGVVLTRVQELLDKINSEVNDAKSILLVKDAQSKIDLAKDSVASQAAKVYTINITTEGNLRINVGTTISQFRKDLVAVHKLVVDARQAVVNLRAENAMMKKEATDSASL